MAMHYLIALDREDDGRWIAEIEALPGVMAYGETQEMAVARVKEIALKTLASLSELGKCQLNDSIQFACG